MANENTNTNTNANDNVEHISGAYVDNRTLVFINGATVSERTLKITS